MAKGKPHPVKPKDHAWIMPAAGFASQAHEKDECKLFHCYLSEGS
jgi:hypothetical protein